MFLKWSVQLQHIFNLTDIVTTEVVVIEIALTEVIVTEIVVFMYVSEYACSCVCIS